MGIPILSPAGRKKVAFQRFNRHQKQNFRYKRYEKCITYILERSQKAGNYGHQLFFVVCREQERLELLKNKCF